MNIVRISTIATIIPNECYQMHMQIRGMRKEDIDSVYDIAITSFDEYFDPSLFSYLLMEWTLGQLVACDVTGRPIGFLMSKKVDSKAHVMFIAVLPAYRKNGVGKELLSRFKAIAFMSGLTSMYLEVRQENLDAIRFYRKNGFTVTGMLREYYHDGGNGLLMEGPVQLLNSE